MTALIKNQIKMMIEESVEKVFQREMRKLRATLLPYVSKIEQRDIEKRFGAPSRKYVRSFSL